MKKEGIYTECHLYIIGNQRSRIKGRFIDNAMASVLQGVKFGTGDLQKTNNRIITFCSNIIVLQKTTLYYITGY